MQALSEEEIGRLVALADEAGMAIMAVYRRADLGVSEKADSSPLTEADLAANAIICRALAAQWPQIPILTEEGANPFRPGEAPQRYWAVDPLDGTREFIKRNGEFTVNVALVEKGFPIFGLVFAPALDAMYVGQQGQGARQRSAGGWREIACRPAQQTLRVVCSRSHLSAETTAWMNRLTLPIERREIGSSLKFCLLAAGEAHVYPRFGPTCIWDTAAGHGVLAAAGGRVERSDGQALLYPHPAQILNPDFIAWGLAGNSLSSAAPGQSPGAH